jgi:hypothetical protein
VKSNSREPQFISDRWPASTGYDEIVLFFTKFFQRPTRVDWLLIPRGTEPSCLLSKVVGQLGADDCDLIARDEPRIVASHYFQELYDEHNFRAPWPNTCKTPAFRLVSILAAVADFGGKACGWRA